MSIDKAINVNRHWILHHPSSAVGPVFPARVHIPLPTGTGQGSLSDPWPCHGRRCYIQLADSRPNTVSGETMTITLEDREQHRYFYIDRITREPIPIGPDTVIPDGVSVYRRYEEG